MNPWRFIIYTTDIGTAKKRLRIPYQHLSFVHTRFSCHELNEHVIEWKEDAPSLTHLQLSCPSSRHPLVLDLVNYTANIQEPMIRSSSSDGKRSRHGLSRGFRRLAGPIDQAAPKGDSVEDQWWWKLSMRGSNQTGHPL